MSARADGGAPGPRRIAIAGNPNSGKTALFNALTGLRQHVANYPGVTVEKREGTIDGCGAVLLDLPGCYSLSARSPDEQIARDIIQGRLPGLRRPDAILIVIDASNLERNLYLAAQILDFGTPVVIACNMMDVARRRGLTIDTDALSRALGVPVIPTVATSREGIDDLRAALCRHDAVRTPSRPWALSGSFEQAVDRAADALLRSGVLPAHAVRGGALLWLMDYLSGEEAGRASAEAFLRRLPAETAARLADVAGRLAESDPDASAAAIEARYAWISGLARRVTGDAAATSAGRRARSFADRLDQVVTHRVLGPILFAAVMFVLFLSIFSWAEPLIRLIERAQDALSAWVVGRLAEGPLRSLMADGIIAGVGAVVGFFPQICILFFCLAVLEDTGYMARAAFLMDRLMNRVGLHGKSFIPLLSSYACAIPGILATRTIEDRRDRFATIMIAPLMSCSARLPVYLIVISAVFGDRPWLKAAVMFGLYAFGTAAALVMALLFRRTLFAGPRAPFIMELPPYHLPRPWPLVRAMWDRSKLFLTNAGTIIFAVCIVIWALSYYPRLEVADLPPPAARQFAQLGHDPAAAENFLASQRLAHSWIGRLGTAIEPAIRPLGFDWRIGIGILSSFLAREVFVGTMGITFAVGRADEDSAALRDQLAAATWPDGRRILVPAAGLSLLVFYVLACQCVSTLAVVRKETGSWRWPAMMFAYMTVLAYAASLAIYQAASRFG
jgi:ferrous iron transport protein B